eukprot:CAMPEP_0115377910 /NCGR_PEP_ID=MMETSP0271-20121206/3740_1 /TAXON_ID=71861 /ORGANISM="Scrippsiella trochoidea, Strain CCMP3099" /LENGTH=183 /DNA_ID=CAMNT_0002801057 /DNA_START=1 /DNA_END=552 /DNA_ORIENTATION=-
MVGEAVGVSGNGDPTSKFYGGQWSSDTFDCFSDMQICALSFFCLPFYSLYQQCSVFPPRFPTLDLPFLGKVSGENFKMYAIGAFVVAAGLAAISKTMTESKTMVIGGEMQTVQQQTSTGELVSMVAGLIDFIWLWMVYKGVMTQFNIQEPTGTSFMKLCCCRCCTLTQVFRHVQDSASIPQAP